MADIARVRVALTGFTGAPGVCTFFGLSGPALFPNVVTLWNNLAPTLPTDVHVLVESSGDVLNDTNGQLTGSWSIAAVPGFNGGQTGAYAAPCGVCLTWITNAIVDGHRLKGRTFVVPIGANTYFTDGTLDDGSREVIAGWAAEYAGSVGDNGVVWHRPKFGAAPSGGGPRPLIRSGSHSLITGSSVRDKVAVLRSRRD